MKKSAQVTLAFLSSFAAVVMTTHKFSALAGGIALAILILILLFRPQGILGRKERVG